MSTPTPPAPGGRPSPAVPRWSAIGPGLVVAATGVGAADLVATLVAGGRYGYLLLWCAVVGCLMKIVLVEGAGRYTLASGRTLFEGWRALGRWTGWYFGPYIVVWGFVYGGAAMAGTGLPLHALFPALGVEAWGVASALVGLALVWWGRYGVFEKVCSALVGVMFVTVVGAAALTVPDLPALLGGLVPRLPPDGRVVYVLGLAGGVGGTITLAAYGYWLREKGWTTPAFMRLMRFDNRLAYVVTGLFVVSTLIVGAELLHAARVAIADGPRGLVSLADVLAARYGAWAGRGFLVGFWAAAMSALIGVWNGVSLMFADFVAQARGLGPDHPDGRAGGRYFRAYLLWLTFPPMLLHLLGQPIGLILAYAVLGALFMPFLAITLLFLLNGERTPAAWRNRLGSNVALAACALLFTALAISEIVGRLRGR